MTAEEIRIGQGATAVETSVAVGAADVALVAANANRTGIIFSLDPAAAGRVTISTANPAVDRQGIVLDANNRTVLIPGSAFPAQVRSAWRAIGSIAANIVTAFESLSTAG